MSQTVLEPRELEGSKTNGRWMVTIFNNPTNSVDEVIYILVQATGCDLDEASIETWEAHTFGKAPVHFDSKEVCEDAARIISSIGVKTEVSREWEEG